MEDIGKYMREKTEGLFEEWDYSHELTVHKARFEKTIFITHQRMRNFIIEKKDLEFYKHIYEKGGIKTLIMIYDKGDETEDVYYSFLQDLDIGENKTVFIEKEEMKKIELNNRRHYGEK